MMEPSIRAIWRRHHPCEITLRTFRDAYNDVLAGHPLIKNIVHDHMGYTMGYRPEGFDFHYNCQGIIEGYGHLGHQKDSVHGVFMFANNFNLVLEDWLPRLERRYRPVLLDPAVGSHEQALVVQLHSAGPDRDLSKNKEVLQVLDGLNACPIGGTKLPWNDYVRLIESSKVFVATDTGALHVAAAVRHPKVVAIYTTESYKNTRSYPGFHNFVLGNLSGMRDAIQNLLSC